MSAILKKQKLSPDPYGSVHLTYATALDLALTVRELREKGDVNAIWLKLKGKDELTSRLPLAIELGFLFHHAVGEDVVMGLWMKTDRPNTLPKGPTHTVGIGCMVVDVLTEKVLAVMERHGPAQGRFKMVTGLVDIG